MEYRNTIRCEKVSRIVYYNRLKVKRRIREDIPKYNFYLLYSDDTLAGGYIIYVHEGTAVVCDNHMKKKYIEPTGYYMYLHSAITQPEISNTCDNIIISSLSKYNDDIITVLELYGFTKVTKPDYPDYLWKVAG